MHDGRIREDDGGSEVEYTADWDRVLEGGRVERDEGGAGVSEGGCAAKGELESLFEEKASESSLACRVVKEAEEAFGLTAKDHEMMPVSVLRLHDARGA